MMDFIKQIIAPPVFEGDQEKTNLARTMNGILWVYLLAMLGGALVVPLSASAYLLGGFITILSLILVGILGLLLLRRGHVIWIARFFTFALWASSTVIVILMGGIETPETGAFIIAIVFAGLFLGISWMYAYTVLSILSILAIYFLEVFAFLPEVDLPLNSLSAMVISSFNVILATLLVAILVRSLQEALTGLRTKQTELAGRNADLNKLMITASQNSQIARAEADQAQAILRAQLDESKKIARISESLRGEQDLATLSRTILRELCTSLDMFMGAIFLREGSLLRMTGSYAYTWRRKISNSFALGEGLVGQAALEKQTIFLTDIPADYISLSTGMLEFIPRVIIAIPFLNGENVIGVIELASLHDCQDSQIALLNKALENISIAFSTAQVRTQINRLLEQTQQQAKELLVREEDLKAVNKEIHAQAESLIASQDRLRHQQKELENANAELEERANTLQRQRTILDLQNRELTEAQEELKSKAEELTLANKYKSEFLANMSHELRTPLNSLLILSRMFVENGAGNLTAEQVEAAGIIYNSGSDLLTLINDILDLSKVEAGRMPFNFELMDLESFANNLHQIFEHMAQEKQLAFEVIVADDLPASIETDVQRVGQILKNFLSNAFKFTAEGGVRLVVEPAGGWVAFRVSDTGIGMTADQQRRVFEAFQQGDGSTSRKYGGTGLGLTISRELSTRLGGQIEVQSEIGRGSTFSLLLPPRFRENEPAGQEKVLVPAKPPAPRPVVEEKPLVVEELSPVVFIAPLEVFLEDDRARLAKGDKILLIIEDDRNFARIVLEYGRQKDFRCLAAGDGETGLQLARAHHPDAILLDLNLPGMSGWEVLHTLKHDSQLRHIPVHILSASEESMDAYKHGALGFLTKPISLEDLERVFEKLNEFQSRNLRSLLIVEDDAELRFSVRQLLGGRDVKITEADSGASALQLLRSHQFDCAILDLTLPDMSGFELLDLIQRESVLHKCPVIVYTGKALTEEENEQLLQVANSVIIKGVKSPERLLDETALFLHRVVADMPEEKQDTIRLLHDQNAGFTGKHILVVDDDMRNAFALSRLLSDKGLKVSLARSGSKALELLENQDSIDLVLMDIMMPEMDGFETMQRIRVQPRFKSLPILALTAKAMKGDLEKCIEAGANDYLSKPVDVERLFSLLRVWLYR